MDMTTMPAWAQTALAWATVVIVALTMLANFLDWAVPRLRALAPTPDEARMLTAVERFALGLTTVLGVVHRLVPQLTVVDPPKSVAPPTSNDDDSNEGGSAPPSASPPPDRATAPAPPPASSTLDATPPTSITLAEPHGPFAV